MTGRPGGNSRFRCPAPNGVSDFDKLAVLLKQSPDTEPSFFSSVLEPEPTLLNFPVSFFGEARRSWRFGGWE
jgi:hypothetical protein